MIDLNLPFIPQSFEFDCWYAALRMLVKFRDPAAEPVAHPTAELEGMRAQSQRTGVREEAIRQGDHPASYWVRKQLAPNRGLKQEEFQELAGYNGLVSPKLPPNPPGWTSDQLESLMRIHGPLWCAFGYGHIVVIKGINAAGQAIIHDPQGNANTLYPIANVNNLMVWEPNAIMFLPDVPNQNAIDPVDPQ
ncbi:papain-like cysteine protease family protein [Nocardia alni]|uniref:papain-like cysteine protease family protein n=1 Tax=Nocardia alni TaxID=2815723 RepID=UPI001C23C4B4|nr:papain-like cysteine protease family protein [Nocardia alni]